MTVLPVPSLNDIEPPNWAALCFARYGILSENPEGCRSAVFVTITHTTSPPILRIAILKANDILLILVAICKVNKLCHILANSSMVAG